jgi:hypothetical protein
MRMAFVGIRNRSTAAVTQRPWGSAMSRSRKTSKEERNAGERARAGARRCRGHIYILSVHYIYIIMYIGHIYRHTHKKSRRCKDAVEKSEATLCARGGRTHVAV